MKLSTGQSKLLVHLSRQDMDNPGGEIMGWWEPLPCGNWTKKANSHTFHSLADRGLIRHAKPGDTTFQHCFMTDEGRRAAAGIVTSAETTTCVLCGHLHKADQGKYGCPNCYGEGLK